LPKNENVFLIQLDSFTTSAKPAFAETNARSKLKFPLLWSKLLLKKILAKMKKGLTTHKFLS
jgi:hypothetical protein